MKHILDIVKFTLVQLLGFGLLVLISEIIKGVIYHPNFEILAIVLMVLCFVFITLGFLWLGFYLNRKYGRINYKVFVSIGIVISILSSIIFFLPWQYHLGTSNYGDFSWLYYKEQVVSNLDMLTVIVGFMVTSCLLTGLWFKWVKR